MAGSSSLMLVLERRSGRAGRIIDCEDSPDGELNLLAIFVAQFGGWGSREGLIPWLNTSEQAGGEMSWNHILWVASPGGVLRWRCQAIRELDVGSRVTLASLRALVDRTANGGIAVFALAKVSLHG